jgi:hypothetical protein
MCRTTICLVAILSIMSLVPSAQAQLPAGWTSQDIGGPSAAGSAQYQAATDTWTIKGDGTGIMGSSDQFRYVYKTLNGDGELVARVASIDPPVSDWSMAGVMIRVVPTLPGSPFIFMGVTVNSDAKDHGVTLLYRTAVGGAALPESAGAMSTPYWVKVKRTGDTFAGSVSPDGKTWTEVGSDTAAGIPKTTYIGYAVTSSVGGKLVTAVFDKGPAKATEPNPADKAIHVAMPLLNWTPGVITAFHDVYFGVNPTPGQAEFMAHLPLSQNTYYPPSVFAPDTTYYWRVDEIGTDGKTVYTGDVWSFTSAPAAAYAPEPWDNRKGVEVEADLTWLPGAGATSHDVYFGTNKAVVQAGDASVFKGNQIQLTFEPGTLAVNTTYYWRIDERLDDGTVRQGPVWSFKTIGPGIGVKAQYFRDITVTGAPILTQIENSIDHNWGGDAIAAGLSDSVSARWTADLEVPFSETYQLITTSDDGVRLWLDGKPLINHWNNHGSTDDAATVDLIGGQVYRLQMEYYENTGSAVAILSWQSPSIQRQVIPAGPLLLPLRATTPYPANKAADVPQTLELHWSPGDNATHHDVYFSDNAQAVADADTMATGVYRGQQAGGSMVYDLGTLEWGKTYYWRVDEVNMASADSPWRGSVWSFTTANFLVVDDFEDYTNDIGGRIFQTWLDGYGYTEPQDVPGNGTGAVVGHDIWSTDSPYYGGTIAETGIVHGGSQAMPMDYNNVISPYYSETERTWITSQDWTVNGMNTLVLYVRGTAANDPGPLYVVVQDKNGKTVVVNHPDVAALTAVQWSEWKIPLKTFTDAGVSVAAIKKMYIGVGDRKAPTKGGAGTLYVDDIRVIKSE